MADAQTDGVIASPSHHTASHGCHVLLLLLLAGVCSDHFVCHPLHSSTSSPSYWPGRSWRTNDAINSIRPLSRSTSTAAVLECAGAVAVVTRSLICERS